MIKHFSGNFLKEDGLKMSGSSAFFLPITLDVAGYWGAATPRTTASALDTSALSAGNDFTLNCFFYFFLFNFKVLLMFVRIKSGQCLYVCTID